MAQDNDMDVTISIHARKRYLISIGLSGVVVALLVTLAFSWFQYNSYKNKSEALDMQYKGKLVDLYKMSKDLSESKATFVNLQNTILADEQDKRRRAYWEKLAYYIAGRYNSYGMKRQKADMDFMRYAVASSFECAEKLYAKHLIGNYSTGVRDCALKSLGHKRKESDFTLECVGYNYEKDYTGKYYIIDRDSGRDGSVRFNLEKKFGRVVECGYDYKRDRDRRFVVKSEYAKKYGKTISSSDVNPYKSYPHLISNGKLYGVPVGKINRDKVYLFLNILSKDFGWEQVNSINLDDCYAILRKAGLWSPSMDKDVMDPEMNTMLRMVEEEMLWKMGCRKEVPYVGDVSFYEDLKKIDGWSGLY